MRQRTSRLLFILLATGSSVLALVQPAAAQGGGPQPVVVTNVEQKPLVAEKVFVGTIEPSRDTIVGSAVDGRVIELVVREGDFVTEGAELARLRTRTIEIELEAARAERRLRESTLEELKNGSRPEEVEQAQARMRAAEADKDYQEYNLQRLLRVRESGRNVITDDEVQEAQARTEQARQTLLEAQAAYELAVEGPRPERIAQAQANLDFQEQQVLLLEDRLEKFSVKAPFDGFITEEHTQSGRWAKQGDPVVSMIDLTLVDVVIELPEQYIAAVHVGTPARVELDALPGDPIDAAVTKIVPLGQRQGRTFPIKIGIQNNVDDQGVPTLKAGMLARVALPVGQSREAVVVPKDALVLGGSTPTVMVVVPSRDNPQQFTVSSVSVKTGIASGNDIEILGDVQPGDRVVIRGNERIRPGMPVQVAN